MKLLVLRPIKLKKAGRIFDVLPGAIVEILKSEKVQTLIVGGYLQPILPPDEAGIMQAAHIWSNVLRDEIWVITHPSALPIVPPDAIVYHPGEIEALRGATPEEIQQVHLIKKELGGSLVAINNREGGNN